MGIELKAPSALVANYVNSVRIGNLVFMAGKGPAKPEEGYVVGKIGSDLTIEEECQAARYTAIAQIAVLKAEVGDLNKGGENCESDGDGQCGS